MTMLITIIKRHDIKLWLPLWFPPVGQSDFPWNDTLLRSVDGSFTCGIINGIPFSCLRGWDVNILIYWG